MKLRRERADAGPTTAVLDEPVVLAHVDSPMTRLGDARPRVGDLLVSSGLLDADSLALSLSMQSGTGRRLGAILLDQGLISEDQLAATLASQMGLPLVDLRRVVPAPEVLALIAESLARSLDIIPFDLTDGVLTVAAADPYDERVPKALTTVAVDTVKIALAPLGQIRDAINASYKALSGISEFVDFYEASAPSVAAAVARAARPAATTGGADAPVVEVVNRLIAQALRDRASDLHLEPTPEFVRVRYRIDGALNEVVRLPPTMGPALVSRLKIMADMNIVEKRRPQDGQFQTIVDGREVDVRVSTTTTIFGEKAVLRLLDKQRSTFNLGDLGMPKELRESYDHIVNAPFGMVVVAGPTGSGKTTTLYATLMQLAQPHLNVMTIEDPVEYIFPSINQIEINNQAGVTFAAGLKSILRQDPDVILVGEVRDAETARIAVQSSLTGHFVLSSIHATDAASALYRLLDMGIERFLVSSALSGVVAQRLLRRSCTSCSVSYEPTSQELAYYAEGRGAAKTSFVHGAGCSYCSGTGFRSRIGVYEILPISDELRAALIGGANPHELRILAASLGMRTLRDEALRLVSEDTTTIAEVMRTIHTLGSSL